MIFMVRGRNSGSLIVSVVKVMNSLFWVMLVRNGGFLDGLVGFLNVCIMILISSGMVVSISRLVWICSCLSSSCILLFSRCLDVCMDLICDIEVFFCECDEGVF